MAAPVSVLGTYGNLWNALTVTHGKAAIAALLSVPTDLEAQVTCEVVTGSPQPTTLTVFSAYKVVGTPTVLSANSTSTTLTVAASPGPATWGFKAGQHVLVQQAGGSKLGELVTITSVAGNVLTVPTLVNAGGYTIGDTICVVATTPTPPVSPSNSSSAYAASTLYSGPTMFLGPANWAIAAINGDASNDVTATVTYDLLTSFV